MFGRIAGRYDVLNRALSLGIDRSWRRCAVERAGALDGALVVDACCGTGDLAHAFARRGARVVGVDFVPQMLARAATKRRTGAGATEFVQGDALRLPLAARRAQVCSVAFGLRNVGDRALALAEMARVVRPGGAVLVLEFSIPPGRLFGAFYRAYFTRLLPLLGRLVSRDRDAYSYLPRTVLAWPGPAELEREMRAAGLVGCGHRLLTRGVACLHWGRRPAETEPA